MSGSYKLELVDLLEIPDIMQEDWYTFNDDDKSVIKLKEDIHKYYENVLKNSDIVRITKRDGKQFWATEVNKNLGVCDDCRECQKEDIRYIEGYKIEFF